jgi:hypothetical protein
MKYLTTSLLLVSGLAAAAAAAQPNNAGSAARLRAEIDALRERLDEMEASEVTEKRIGFSGDLRYRHETINDDASTERNRHRIRARFNIAADLGEDLSVGITLATGGSNPVSANQSLDGGFTRKDIGFDRAYFAWDINDELRMTGGKMPNPMFRPGGHYLIFDGDLNPEGLALKFDSGNIFANIGGLWVDERSGGDDAILYALQGGYRTMINDGAELTIGASYYNYQDTQGFEPFYLGEAQGNSVDLAGNMLYDYDLTELFAQVEFEVGGHPLEVFFDYVENSAADNFETGSAIGLKWRSASNPGDWELGWAYQDLEADAVIATFTDSDFGGGGTDAKGHVFEAAYRLRSNVRLNGTYFLNERGVAAGNERDYNRLQLDVSFVF